jgi:hypothetical protein
MVCWSARSTSRRRRPGPAARRLLASASALPDPRTRPILFVFHIICGLARRKDAILEYMTFCSQSCAANEAGKHRVEERAAEEKPSCSTTTRPLWDRSATESVTETPPRPADRLDMANILSTRRCRLSRPPQIYRHLVSLCILTHIHSFLLSFYSFIHTSAMMSKFFVLALALILSAHSAFAGVATAYGGANQVRITSMTFSMIPPSTTLWSPERSEGSAGSTHAHATCQTCQTRHDHSLRRHLTHSFRSSRSTVRDGTPVASTPRAWESSGR